MYIFIFELFILEFECICLFLGEKRRVCYHTNWSQYRPGVGKFVPSKIDPFLCTHIAYAFAKLDENHLATFEWNDEAL